MYQIVLSKTTSHTKHFILSDISKAFNLLGLLSPCVIIAKIILQELWSLKLSWDEGVPVSLHTKRDKFQNECSNLNNFKIPCRVVCDSCNRFEFHGFADASQQAYGACIYVHTVDEFGTIQTTLFCSKTRAAPVKSMSIPRLELCAAVLLVQLIKKVSSSLHLI